MSAEDNQPDWDRIAEKFDLWLPQLEPVGDALLDALDARPGERILDLASGTGEPALSLARQLRGQAEILGVDSAEGMVRVARSKVAREGLQGIGFQTMPAEQLDFPDNHFDRILCRFGVMLFQNPLAGVKEMYRVLRPGGRFAIAVWSSPETMPTLYWSYEAFKDRLHDDLHPPLAKVTSLGHPGRLAELLSAGGFSDYVIDPRRFDYQFDSFEDYWNTVEASDILRQQYDALPSAEHAAVRDEIGRLARDFVHDGRLTIPHEYLLASGRK